jgi:hypothetical protein
LVWGKATGEYASWITRHWITAAANKKSCAGDTIKVHACDERMSFWTSDVSKLKILEDFFLSFLFTEQ